MNPTTNTPAQAAATNCAHGVVTFLQAALGPELLGAYLIGSLAHGGFSRRYSDVDIALVTETGLTPQTLDRIRNEAVALSADWGPKLSVFWTNRHFDLGRFPPLDRIDYLDHAVVLMERERVRPTRPSLEDVRQYLCGTPFANWTDSVRRFAAADALAAKDYKAYLRTLLYPGRFCYSWMTGRIDSNDEAVAFLSKTHPPQLDVSLIARALQCRQADADPDSLFEERTNLQTQVDACAALLTASAPMLSTTFAKNH
jgi:predicted nucleotidyltransferase